MRRFCTAALLSCAAISGCSMFQSAHREDREYDLSLVRGALIWGTPRQAAYYLDKVEEDGLSADAQVQADLLRAEIDLRTGNPDRAAALAGSAAAHDRFRGPAMEVAGKALIRMNDFRGAASRFAEAQTAYASPTDAARAADLRRLAEGLALYSEGSLSEARTAWAGISDERLRGEIGRWIAGDRSGAIARGGQQ